MNTLHAVGRFISYVGFWSALVPLAAFAIVVTTSPRRPADAVLIVTIALALSFLMDALAKMSTDAGIPNMWVTYIGAPIQFWVLLRALTPPGQFRLVGVFFMLIAMTSMLQWSLRVPETFVQVVVGAWIAVVAYRSVEIWPYRIPVILYTAGAIPFLMMMGLPGPAIVLELAWMCYKLITITALWLLAFLLVRGPRPTMEVSYEGMGAGSYRLGAAKRGPSLVSDRGVSGRSAGLGIEATAHSGRSGSRGADAHAG